ncbi:MAG TPA: BatD family protein [Luteibaculaceae bacterium]|nr:BatD family protein [Luteibaculaceae bacterium]
MSYPKKLLLLIMATLFAGHSFAQEMTFVGSANPNPVSVGQRFTITFKLTNARAKISPPSFSGLSVVFGPSVSESTRIYNGRYSTSMEVSYVVVAEREGKITIDKAKAYTDKGVLESDPFTVQVNKSNISSSEESAPTTQQKGDIILSISANKTTAYIGEPIVLTYYLYSRYDRLELVKADYPNLNGFWTEESKQQSATWENQLATINGQNYKVAILKKQVVFPQKEGQFQISPFSIECLVNRSFFSVGSKFTLKSNSPSIAVKPFPSPKPSDFTNQSGSYKLDCSISSKEVKANEPITLKIKVSGQGNLKIFNVPKPDFPTDFEVYDPKITDQIKFNGNNLAGSREFEYLIIPRYPGEYQIPAVQFSYFDLNTKAYKSLGSPSYTLQINKGSGSGGTTVIAGNQQEIKLLTKDIRFIYSGEISANEPSVTHPSNGLFWVLCAGMPTLGIGLGWVVRIRKKNLADTSKVKNQLAGKTASKHLSEANKALKSGNQGLAYQNCTKALYGFISDRYHLPLADLNRGNIQQVLREKGIEMNHIEVLLILIDQCEMARYAPITATGAHDILKNADEWITNMEKIYRV